MKRLIVLFLFLAVRAHAQDWVEYYHDSTLIVTMPYYHYPRMENGLLMSSARIEDGVIVVGRLKDSPKTPFIVRDTAELKNAYAAYRDGLLKSQGELVKSEIIKKDGLKWLYFVARGPVNGVDQITYNLAIFINDGVYSLTFFEMGPPTPKKLQARKKIFSSARIAPGVSRIQVSTRFQPVPWPFKFFTPTMALALGVGFCTLLVFLFIRIKKK